MMDRRSLLKRLGLVGLAIPTAMALEGKLVLPETERATAQKVIQRGVVDLDPRDMLISGFEVRRSREMQWPITPDDKVLGPLWGRERLEARWSMLGESRIEPGQMVRLLYEGKSAIVAIRSVMYRSDERFGHRLICECEGEGVWAA